MGTSAGSIMATLLAAGYEADEMSAALNEQQDGRPVFLGFLQDPPAPSDQEVRQSSIRELLKEINIKMVPDMIEDLIDDALAVALARSPLGNRIYSFIERGGLFAADSFLVWLKDKLNTGVYNRDSGEHPKGAQRNFGEMTLAEFTRASGTDLSLIAADTSDSQMLILNSRTAPDLPLVWGVRMSMSVPLLWQEVVWQSEWGAYMDKDISGNTIVDGGLLSNFPIELFISKDRQVIEVMGDKNTDDLAVIGFLIDEDEEVPNAPPPDDQEEQGGFGKLIGELKTVGRVKNLANTMMQAHDKIVIDTFERFVVRLPAKGYGTIEFGMSPARRDALVNAGQKATADYFDRQEIEAPEGVMMDMAPVDTGQIADQASKISAKILDY
jgi:predicted acylesterase/phospholipase RssA